MKLNMPTHTKTAGRKLWKANYGKHNGKHIMERATQLSEKDATSL